MAEKLPGAVDCDVTALLVRWRSGDRHAADVLIAHVHRELRRIAARHMRHEQHRSILQTSALVNEAWLRFAANPPNTANREHFFMLAARIMRQILVDAARARRRAKRAGIRVTFSGIEPGVAENTAEILSLDEILTRLTEFDPRKAQVVEMRFFAGMDVEEVAQALGVSKNTVIRDWSIGRAWLLKEMAK